MKAVYIHGYESVGLSPEKTTALEELGLEIVAPVFQFTGDREMIYKITNLAKQEMPHMLIGSSMGGRMAFYISNKLRVPALLFNPALRHKELDQHLPIPTEFLQLPFYHRQRFIFGAKDEVVAPGVTKKFLAEHYPCDIINKKLLTNLAHPIPVEVLKKETKDFIAFLQEIG